MYAPQYEPVQPPITLRLIGVLDGDLIDAFKNVERGLVAAKNATVIVDVRDLAMLGDRDVVRLTGAIAQARLEGRDVRLDPRTLAWRRVVKRDLGTQPAVDPGVRGAVRRTVIIAHSGKQKRR
ncbi:MAG TPA: hypothetical protein VE591_09125 [Candidatus Acidoferrum sp.]|nr:hypothetical protein [Candidatus Acidoferrum sp.]